MLNKKELKELVGQSIWCIPRMNAVSRSIPLNEQITEFKLIKVGSKRMTIETVGNGGMSGAFGIDGGMDVHNYGYYPFASIEDANDYFTDKEIISKIQNYHFNGVSHEDILKIQNILGL